MKKYKTYQVVDLRNGILSEAKYTTATTPTEAVKNLYPTLNFRRDYSCKGEIVVKSTSATYVYKILYDRHI